MQGSLGSSPNRPLRWKNLHTCLCVAHIGPEKRTDRLHGVVERADHIVAGIWGAMEIRPATRDAPDGQGFVSGPPRRMSPHALHTASSQSRTCTEECPTLRHPPAPLRSTRCVESGSPTQKVPDVVNQQASTHHDTWDNAKELSPKIGRALLSKTHHLATLDESTDHGVDPHDTEDPPRLVNADDRCVSCRVVSLQQPRCDLGDCILG